jgi:hypothetical protein
VSVTSSNGRVSAFDGLLADIFKMSERRARPQSATAARGIKEIEALARSDYRRSLRKHFDRCEVQGIIAEARRRVWPDLNRASVKIGPPAEFMRRWSDQGVEFRLANLATATGQALLGFYMGKSPVSRRPLICVNTAHHEVAVGAAFSHEMGHHVTAQMFDVRSEPAHFLFYTGYGEHLGDPVELAADILVSVGVYSRAATELLLGKRREGGGGPGMLDGCFAEVLRYFDRGFGLAFDAKLAIGQKLQYLAGLVHYTQLRKALRDEYDV